MDKLHGFSLFTGPEERRVIVRLIDVASDQVRSVATASEQQSAASEEINRSIEEISTISSETSQAMGQAHQAVMELANQSLVLKGLIEDMKSGESGAGETAPRALAASSPRAVASLAGGTAASAPRALGTASRAR